MVSKAVIIFFFTVTVAYGRIIQWPEFHPHQMVLMPLPGSLDYPLAPSYIHPVDKCDEAQPEKTVEIPGAPVFAPIAIPELPVPMIVENPNPTPIVEPCEHAFVPAMPAMDIPAAPIFPPVIMPLPEILQPEPCMDEEVFGISHQPMVVPQAPELPAFVMPELPVVEVPMSEPYLEYQPTAPVYVPPAMPLPIVEPAFMPEMQVMNIPTAPALPPLEMPVLPEIVVPEPCLHEEVLQEIAQPMLIPHAPELPAFVMSELPIKAPASEPCLEDLPIPVAPVSEYMPIVEPVPLPEIPVAPELPPFTIPALSEVMVLPEPCLDEIAAPEVNYQPMVVPQGPELPAFVMPELPVKIEVSKPEPCLEDNMIPLAPMPEFIPLPAPMPVPIQVAPEVDYKPMVIPHVPELPAFVMPELPTVEPMTAPCLEDIPAMPAVPESPKPHLPEILINKPEDPCFGNIALVVPQPPKLPELIARPAMPALSEPMVDPCEPSKPAMMLPPYFASHPSYMPMGFFHGRSNLLGLKTIPYVRHF